MKQFFELGPDAAQLLAVHLGQAREQAVTLGSEPQVDLAGVLGRGLPRE